jgi:predicted component of type VI protein secretion system
MDVRFVVLSSAGQERPYPVRLPIVVGRSDEAKFRFKNDSVSRRHCEFFIQDDVIFVRDLGSTNGTLLDQQSIAGDDATPVPSGSVVRVGNMAFRVEYGSAADPLVEPHAGSDTLRLAENAEAPAAEPSEPAEPAESGESETADGQEGPQTAFVGLAAAEEPAAEGFAWPAEPEAAAPPDDENLNDFFKSLS